jgi:hypothetical protein
MTNPLPTVVMNGLMRTTATSRPLANPNNSPTETGNRAENLGAASAHKPGNAEHVPFAELKTDTRHFAGQRKIADTQKLFDSSALALAGGDDLHVPQHRLDERVFGPGC